MNSTLLAIKNLNTNGVEGIVDITDLPEPTRELFQLVDASMRNLVDLVSTLGEVGTSVPSIFTCIGDTQNIDAYAARLSPFAIGREKEHEYIISIYSGSIMAIAGCFLTLLAHREVLPEIGNTDCECYEAANELSGLLDLLDQTQDTNLSKAYPVDSDRQSYAIMLTLMAIEFLFCHELSHILRGHIGYLLSSDAILGIFHVAPSAVSAQSQQSHADRPRMPARKVLEHDADLFAAFLIPTVLNEGGKIFANYMGHFEKQYDILEAWGFAIGCLFHLFEEVREKNSPYNSADYPPADTRFYTVLSATATVAGKNWGQALAHSFDNILQTLNTLDIKYRHNRFDPTSIHELVEEAIALGGARSRIIPRLNKYKIKRKE